MAESGIYGYLKVNSFREYEIDEKRKSSRLKNASGRAQEPNRVTQSDNDDPKRVRDLQLVDIDDSFMSLFYGWIASYILLVIELLMDRMYSNIN